MLYQLHGVLIVVLDYAAIVVVVSLVVGLLLSVGSFVKRLWQHWRRRSRLDYERYRAEEEIRHIKRQARRDMLTAEREFRRTDGYGDVIEGTCHEIEVRS